MAAKKTQFKKPSHGLYIENSLWEFCRNESIKHNSFHSKTGSSSEYIRRAFKAWILKEMPYLKKIMTDVEWNEAY